MAELKSAYRALSSRRAVFQAMAECDALGRDAFLRRYGFKVADKFVMRHGGREYDAKAIVGVAFGYQFPEKGPPAPGDFSSGKAHAAGFLARLGFDVDGIAPRPDDWTLAEVTILVDAYFALYARTDRDQLAVSDSYIDAAADKLTKRNMGSVGRKVSNINSVLVDLGMVPLGRFGISSHRQLLLTAVTRDWLATNGAGLDRQVAPGLSPSQAEVLPPSAALTTVVREGRATLNVDFAARDERNRELGRAGEEWVCAYLRRELIHAGRADLADQVIWAADVEGDGLGYDIRAFTPSGEPILIEVKTTNGGIAAPFFVSLNEVAASVVHRERYVLFRLFAFRTAPQFYRLRGALADVCQLAPAGYRALPSTAPASD